MSANPQIASTVPQVATEQYKGPLVRSMEVPLYPGDPGAVLQHPSGYGVIVRLAGNHDWNAGESVREHSMRG